MAKTKKRKKKVGNVTMPVFTKGKLLRLLFFAIFVSLGIILNKYIPAIKTFGWGFTFGMVCMAILTG